MNTTEHPATVIVHTASGEVACCEKHAKKLRGLHAFLGFHTNETPLLEFKECSNCAHEAGKVNLK